MLTNNPYVSRGPVRDPQFFFGRQHELDEIAAFVRGNQSVSIIGPRKIGKTSLLFHLMRATTWATLQLTDQNLFVYLDCEVLGEGTHEEIFGIFASEISTLLAERQLPAEAAVEAAIAKPTRLAFENAIRKLNQRGLRLILILDEFERLSTNPHLNVNFFNALRSAAGRYQLVFLTASARPLIELTYSGKSQEILSSPFFNIFAPLFLSLFPAVEALTLITEPLTAHQPPLSAELKKFIYAYAGGHPFALQVTCFYAFTASDSAEIARRATEELTPHFEYYWRNLSVNEQNALSDVAHASARAQHDTAMRGTLRDLIQQSFLVIADGVYRYPSDAWGNFVAQHTPQLAPRPNTPHKQLGPYEVQELLGRGGMAEVYKGWHPRLERVVAIKLLAASLATEQDFRARFEREARAVAALRHPHIVQVFDFGEADGAYYMVMEFINGKDLSHLLKASGALLFAQAWPLLCDLASALDYAHAQGLVHRDIKPSNVLLDLQGNATRAVLTDFGIARLVTHQTGLTQSALIGTLDYMAPEQIRAAGTVTHRADLYALGVMAFQMLTGQLPYTGDAGGVMLGHLHQPIPDARLLNPQLTVEISDALRQAMAKDPAERFANAQSFVEALRP